MALVLVVAGVTSAQPQSDSVQVPSVLAESPFIAAPANVATANNNGVLSPDGNWAMRNLSNGYFDLFNGKTSQYIGHGYHASDFTPRLFDSTGRFITINRASLPEVRKSGTGEVIGTIKQKCRAAWFEYGYIVTRSPTEITLFNPQTLYRFGNPIHPKLIANDEIVDVMFAMNGKYVIAIQRTDSRLFDVETRELVSSFGEWMPGPQKLAEICQKLDCEKQAKKNRVAPSNRVADPANGPRIPN
jgi:hypothetical protein